MTTNFARYLDETARLAATIDADGIERLAATLASVRARGGRIFFLGVGGRPMSRCSQGASSIRGAIRCR
jgi:D-sedoheptulose 7-phosphate isomerase